MKRGVNLGNWLVLEKWMSPALFEGTGADDEATLVTSLPEDTLRRMYRVHRDEWVNDRDFAFLARLGVDLVRLPVPYFVFGGFEPYVACVDYVDRAFEWAQRHGIRVLLDLHTVPDSQNGFDNGGMTGVCKWHQNPSHVQTAVDVVDALAARYAAKPNLWGIEVLNEPITQELWELLDVPRRYPAADPEYARGSEGVPTSVLSDYYHRAYERIRHHSATARVVFHDGFRTAEWFSVLTSPDFTDIAVDLHLYLMMHTLAHGRQGLDGYVSHIRTDLANKLQEASRHFPVIVGEWCADTSNPDADTLDPVSRRAYYQRLYQEQDRAFAAAEAWAYWSYKGLSDEPARDVWDFGKAVALGLLPGRVTQRAPLAS